MRILHEYSIFTKLTFRIFCEQNEENSRFISREINYVPKSISHLASKLECARHHDHMMEDVRLRYLFTLRFSVGDRSALKRTKLMHNIQISN